MKKQTVVLITLVLVIGAAGLAVQAAEKKGVHTPVFEPRWAEPHTPGSGDTEVPTPPGWPVRYDTGFISAAGFNSLQPIPGRNTWNGGRHWHEGNLFNTNSGTPLLLTGGGVITGVTWFGAMYPYSVVGGPTGLAPNPNAYFVKRDVIGYGAYYEYPALFTTIVPFPAPPMSVFGWWSAPLPPIPAPGPSGIPGYGFAAAVVGGASIAGTGTVPPLGAVFNYQVSGQGSAAVRNVATPTGFMTLGYHGRDMTIGTTYLWNYGERNTLVRVRGNLLTPIELLSVTAE